MVKKIVFIVIISLMMLGQSFATAAIKEQKLTASDGMTFDRFGWSVSVSGDGNTIVAGSPYSDLGSNIDQGAVYVFIRSGQNWTQQQKLTVSDGMAFDHFGWSVSVSADGNTIVVGAPYSTMSTKKEQGSAYVFMRSGGKWTQQQKLIASDGMTGDRFGWSVSISSDGNTIVIGSYLDDIGSNREQGSIYIFLLSGENWTQRNHIIASDGAAGDYFGWSTSVNTTGNTIVTGASGDNIGKKTGQGSAYILFKGLIPNLTAVKWGIIIFIAFAGSCAIYYVIRKRRV
jgi:hypothetical protein